MKMLDHDVRVDFGGRDVGMTKHDLDTPQVGSSLKHMRREAVTQLVR